MCGIVGILDVSKHAPELRAVVEAMTDAIVHRGPDDDGNAVEDGIGIGMRRLSIIDVAGGRQPIANEDGSVLVILNGEIYNYPDLARDLKSRGHRFRTHSDTEVIVHLYEEHGVGVFERLRGMFAIAIWDRRSRELVLGRDRLGKKPLFYAHPGRRFLFGSEIKAILAGDPALAEDDPDALVPYLRYGFVPEPQTAFRAVRKLPAGHWLRLKDGTTEIQPYWRLRFEEGPSRTLAEWREELDALLAEAVRIRLMSEVPLGVFLSGGVDSSAIVTYAHRAGVSPLRTFTIGFDRPEWDESRDAEVLARRFGTEHHTLILRQEMLSSNLPDTILRLAWHFDEPFADASALPTYYVSKLSRQFATVMLSGDGGDELFAGYTSYLGMRFAQRYGRLPRWLTAGIPPLATAAAGLCRGRLRYRALRAARVLRDSTLPLADLYFTKMAVCDTETLRGILAAPFARSVGDSPLVGGAPADAVAMLASDAPLVTRVGYADIRFRLLDDMLVKVDRMSMANSLEVRSPFLDHRLVEFAARVPAAFKLRGNETKALLRDLLRPQLPAAVLKRPKRGFSVPLRDWLRYELAEMVGDYLSPSGGRLDRTYFNPAGISRLLEAHRRGRADHSASIWTLLMYAAWRETLRAPAMAPRAAGSGDVGTSRA